MNITNIVQNITKIAARASDPFIIARASYFVEPKRSDTAWDYSAEIINFLTPIVVSLVPSSDDMPALINVVVQEVTQYLRPSNITLDYFRFPYSPSSISYSLTAHQNLSEFGNNVIVRTGWGLKTIPLTVNGWVNIFPPSSLYSVLDYAEYRLSWGYLMLYLLEKWLKRNTNYLLFMIVGGRVWVGWYNSFNYSLNANSFSASFTLNFNAHPYSGEFIANASQIVEMLKHLRTSGVLTNYSYGDPVHWSIWSE